MFYKKIIFLVLLCCFSNIIAQTRNHEWQVGVGAAITKFGNEDAFLIGDKYQFQIPRINITKPLTDNLAIDLAFSANTFDLGFIENTSSYLSVDASLRYFFDIGNVFFPYVFAGASVADSEFKLAPTINVGAGASFWFNDVFGINAQAYYKNSLDTDNLPSHIQVTAGMVFALNLYDLFFNGATSNGFCH